MLHPSIFKFMICMDASLIRIIIVVGSRYIILKMLRVPYSQLRELRAETVFVHAYLFFEGLGEH